MARKKMHEEDRLDIRETTSKVESEIEIKKKCPNASG